MGTDVTSHPGGRGPDPTATRAGDVPIACTLAPAEVPGRVAEWRDIGKVARSRRTTGDGAVLVELGDAVALEELARLVAAERACCPFFSFVITVDAAGLSLEVRAPQGAGDLVTQLLG